MLTRMGWKNGRGLGYHEDGTSKSLLSLEDTNGCNGFGLRHVSDRCTLDPRTVKVMESWEIGLQRITLPWRGWGSVQCTQVEQPSRSTLLSFRGHTA
jgi:hypothetical protein